MSESCSVYWYWLLVGLPPMRIGGGICRKARMPGTFANCGRSSATIWSAVFLRCPRGFSCARMMPALPTAVLPRGPAEASTLDTSGCARTIAMIWSCFSRIAAKPMPCAASVEPKISPWSSVGRKPFGILTKSQTVAASTTADIARTTRGCRSAGPSVRSYMPRNQSKPVSLHL